MIYIELEEEYGYRQWIWAFPGTAEEALAEWEAGYRPLGFFGPSNKGFKGTIHQVHYTYVWSDVSPRGKPFHCQGRGRANFCDECSKLVVTEYVSSDDSTGTEIPFSAVTSFKDFSGHGHVHEKDDTYLEVKTASGPRSYADRHEGCDPGCDNCRECGGHTKGQGTPCRICKLPLCEGCMAETGGVCGDHDIVEIVAKAGEP